MQFHDTSVSLREAVRKRHVHTLELALCPENAFKWPDVTERSVIHLACHVSELHRLPIHICARVKRYDANCVFDCEPSRAVEGLGVLNLAEAAVKFPNLETLTCRSSDLDFSRWKHLKLLDIYPTKLSALLKLPPSLTAFDANTRVVEVDDDAISVLLRSPLRKLNLPGGVLRRVAKVAQGSRLSKSLCEMCVLPDALDIDLKLFPVLDHVALDLTEESVSARALLPKSIPSVLFNTGLSITKARPFLDSLPTLQVLHVRVNTNSREIALEWGLWVRSQVVSSRHRSVRFALNDLQVTSLTMCLFLEGLIRRDLLRVVNPYSNDI